ncbi:MAG: hypothetical protein NTY36_12865 [Deltaproteobacteria bacterium]|nr:hypothetical protein [Deltaproteobacteria bacterium]
MSKRIEHIMEVLKYVKDNWDHSSTIAKIRVEADKYIAQKYNITDKTVSDKYRRQLKDESGHDLSTGRFDKLLENWIKESDPELMYFESLRSINFGNRWMQESFNRLLEQYEFLSGQIDNRHLAPL